MIESFELVNRAALANPDARLDGFDTLIELAESATARRYAARVLLADPLAELYPRQQTLGVRRSSGG